MSGSQAKKDDSDGCWACAGVLVAVILIGMAVISLGAIIDPFDWMPTAAQIWDDCEDETGGNACDLANRFPGFWGHLAANLAFAAVAAIVLLLFVAAVADLVDTRSRRYEDPAGAAAFASSRASLATASVLLAAVAALPIVVRVA
jgi:hypothetical protein